MALSSPILSLLDEPEYQLKEQALTLLNEKVDEIWPEIADRIATIEELYEDSGFPAHHLAALVASKVYYNLSDFDSSVRYALAAGPLLDFSQTSEYHDTIISQCIRKYVELRQQYCDKANRFAVCDGDETKIDPKLVEIVESMLVQCARSGKVNLALGIAIEARRLDIIESILKDNPQHQTIKFVLDSSITLLTLRSFRTEVLRLLDRILFEMDTPEYLLVTTIITQLDDAELAERWLNLLISSNPLQAYQLALDLVASASQQLLEKTSATFRQSPKRVHAKLVKILSGVPTCDYEITFLKCNNHTDESILTRTKTVFDSRNSMFHSALSFQNAFLHVGTTDDDFFRSNIDWLGRATHWTKFTATAALGVIHRGNLTQGRRILKPYLPGGSGSAHSGGGSLYGLGLVFAGFGKEVLDYLQQIIADIDLGSSSNGTSEDQEVILHGACLGVALAAMRTGNIEVYELLRNVLYVDSAIAGEAAGLAMGVVMLGSKSSEAEEVMLRYAHETQHEKIIRSLALGLALLNYGREENSDDLIKNLLTEQEPILRYGGCFTIALAYAGTGNNKAISLLLHTAVSDTSDDVRRAAVMSLGFIFIRNPTALPRMVELLSESHNSHVRYGTTMALGVACAGTGLPAAVELLLPLMKDPVDFVCQGAMIALSMVLIQQTDPTPHVKEVREHFASVVKDKHEDSIAKFGAAIAQGIIDAGGCNTTISLENEQTGNLNMKAVTGIAIFLQYWYWFPFAHFLSLAFTPTTVICVCEDLKIPELELECSAPARNFGYPPRVEEPFAKAPEQLVTAILSTTMKDKRRARKEQRRSVMQVDDYPEKAKEKGTKNQANEKEPDNPVGVGKDGAAGEKGSSAKSKDSDVPYVLLNMSRVVPWQRRFMRVKEGRFQPIAHRERLSGVIVVQDLNPNEEIKVIKTLRQSGSQEDETEEAPLPAPFRIKLD